MGAFGNDDGGDVAGKVYLFLGDTLAGAAAFAATDADLMMVGNGDFVHLGGALSSADDLNEDGHDDWMVGADGATDEAGDRRGAVYVVSSTQALLGTTSTPAAADVEIVGETSSRFGGAMSAGDFDGNGETDLAVRASTEPAGKVYVVLDQDLPRSGTMDAIDATFVFGPEDEDSELDGAIGMGGDVDGDGRAELLIGTWGWDPNGTIDKWYGRAFLVLGR